MEDETLVIDKLMALMGVKCKSNKMDKLNACLQMARWYIYSEKLNSQEPFLYKFLCIMKHNILIEKTIFLRNDLINKYNRVWGEIEEYID
jgi:hypothetical protein